MLSQLYSVRGGTEELRDELTTEILRLHDEEQKSIDEFLQTTPGE